MGAPLARHALKRLVICMASGLLAGRRSMYIRVLAAAQVREKLLKFCIEAWCSEEWSFECLLRAYMLRDSEAFLHPPLERARCTANMSRDWNLPEASPDTA